MPPKRKQAIALVEALAAKEGRSGPNRRLIAKARRRIRREAITPQLLEDLSAALYDRPDSGGSAKRRAVAEPGLLAGLAATVLTWLLPPTLVLVAVGSAVALLYEPRFRPFTVAALLAITGLLLALWSGRRLD